MDSANPQKCPLCGSPTVFSCASTDYISGERFSIITCTSCGLGVTSPFVPAAELSKYYAQGYYKKRKSGADAYINRARLKKILRRLKGRKLLDVGCGNGALLDLFGEAGWDAQGVEMAPPEHFVSDAVRKKIFIGDIRSTSFAPHSFDVVTLFHVLEHMTAPQESLAKIHELLADDGLLVIEVPNHASWQARLTKGKWFNYDVPRHVFHFTPQSLTMIVEKAGFRFERLAYYSPIYSYFSWVQSLLNLTTHRNNILFDLLNGKSIASARWWDVLATTLFVVPASFLAVPLTIVESLCKRGGIITAYAKPR